MLIVVRNLVSHRVGIMRPNGLIPFRVFLLRVADLSPHGRSLRRLCVLSGCEDIVNGTVQVAALRYDSSRFTRPIFVPLDKQLRVVGDDRFIKFTTLGELDKDDG